MPRLLLSKPLHKSVKPKPLLPVAGRPLIDRALDMVADAGITRTVVNLHYKGGRVKADIALAKKRKIEEEKKIQEDLKAEERRKEEVKKEAEKKAKAKLEEELGVVQGEGETLEEAIKRRANEAMTEEAAKALEELLNGN